VALPLARTTAERYGATFREYEDHGHWLLEERPDETVAALTRFLQ